MDRWDYNRPRPIEYEEDLEDEPEEPKQPEPMASWFSRAVNSHQVQLGAVAAISGAVVAGGILGYQHSRRKHRIEDLKSSIPEFGEASKLTDYGAASPEGFADKADKDEERSAALAARARAGDYHEDLILEQLARNRVFLTDVGLQKLRNSFVIVVGCGGVGSHATAALARSGVSKIRLIDFDQVTLSSLNRHAVATLADVGTQKVQCLRRRLEQIVPWVNFDCRNELFSSTAADHLLGPWPLNSSKQKPDYIIDAIDNIDSKVALLAYCYNNSLPVISSMGAGCKSDPTRIFIGDISTSTEDPLSRSTRRRLRAMGIEKGIPVVYSTEKPGPGKAQLLPLPEAEFEKGKVGELGVLPDFRVRILPVLGTMPAVFGYAVANHVILEIAEYPHEYIPWKSREKMYDAILANLQGSEERLVVHSGEDTQGVRIPVTKEDVGYLVEEVFKGRSVISGLPTRLILMRWRQPEGGIALGKKWDRQKNVKLPLGELVCMTKDEAVVHEREVLRGGKSPEDLYDKDTLARVEQAQMEEAMYEQFR